MKKLFLVCFLFINLVLLAGCGQFGPLYLPPKEEPVTKTTVVP